MVSLSCASHACRSRSRTRLSSSFSEEFKVVEVKVGVHQGSVLCPLLSMIVLETLSGEFGVGYSWEMLYADYFS